MLLSVLSIYIALLLCDLMLHIILVMYCTRGGNDGGCSGAGVLPGCEDRRPDGSAQGSGARPGGGHPRGRGAGRGRRDHRRHAGWD